MVRWGILGPGKIAHQFAQAFAGVERARITAVGSRALDRARAFADEYDVENAHGSYNELVADPRIDAVYIATPHRYHLEHSISCLESGKHVLCEKPLTVNTDQARHLAQIASDKGLFLMEALWTRFLPVYHVVRAWLDEDRIGNVHLLSSTFSFTAAREETGRLLNHELAGGSLLDLGIYNAAVSQWVTGVGPSTVTALGTLGSTGVDETVSAILDYEVTPGHTVQSQFTCSLLAVGENAFDIMGAKGRIRIHPPFWGATRATLSTSDGDEDEHRPFLINGFENQIEEAGRCIRTGLTESPVMPHSETILNMRTLDNIRSQIGLRYSFE